MQRSPHGPRLPSHHPPLLVRHLPGETAASRAGRCQRSREPMSTDEHTDQMTVPTEPAVPAMGSSPPPLAAKPPAKPARSARAEKAEPSPPTRPWPNGRAWRAAWRRAAAAKTPSPAPPARSVRSSGLCVRQCSWAPGTSDIAPRGLQPSRLGDVERVEVDDAMEDGVRADSASEYVIPRKRFPLTSTTAGRQAMCSLRDVQPLRAAGSLWGALTPALPERPAGREAGSGDTQYIGRAARN